MVEQVSKPFTLSLIKYRTRMLSLLANIYAAGNYYTEAIQTLQVLLPLLRDANDIISEVHGYTLAIELFGELDMPNEALKYANIIYNKFDQIRLPRDQCFTALDYATSIEEVYGSVPEKWSDIDVLYQDALEFCKLASEGLMLAEISLGQARMFIKREKYTQARELAQYGLGLSSSIPYRQYIVKAHLLLAKIALYQQQSQIRLEQLNKALALSLTIDNSRLLSETYQLLAELHESLGHTDKALTYLKLYQVHYAKKFGVRQSNLIAFETAKLGDIVKTRQMERLSQDFYTVKAELKKSKRDHERMMTLLISGCLVMLTLFISCTLLLKRRNRPLADQGSS